MVYGKRRGYEMFCGREWGVGDSIDRKVGREM